ncbi:uncharacterized protein BJ171DRAFT_462732 [Polychytrium aggregatum]|uniref:uncharacterized protein n=1 Tax=Polychytrium aggregatum TaxID=110093 RepID=UPI0022FF45B5|nr:uncharacterized protein BJ171DRAFT_462732 [Polychytrium aggregatum]KAI9197461.1 hypothetical protein BJ171DRAFT_462732 [Polychytrium aggregatum]
MIRPTTNHNPDVFTIICFNDSFQLALDHATINSLLLVCKRAQPLLSLKVTRFHTWCKEIGLCHLDGSLRTGLTPSDQIALSLHCKDQATADRSWLVAQAEQKSAAASYLLARILQADLDGPQPQDESLHKAQQQQIFQYLHQAATANHPMAQLHLAECYRNGHGINQDHTKAVELYRKLAGHGFAHAQLSLGRCYENGEGVDQSFNAAIEWYTKAADQGSDDGRLRIVFLLCLSFGLGTAVDRKKAAVIFEQLANDDHSDSQFCFGDCYHWGHGVPQDHSKAFRWWKKAAKQGNSYGQWWVGVCYAGGHGVSNDYTKEVKWYRRSAHQGNRRGQYWLGYCYEHGYGTAKDTEAAVFWYRKSAEQGSEEAINSLRDLGS